MLWVAAALALRGRHAAARPSPSPSWSLVNGVFAFVQERGAERAAERLADLLPAGPLVRRDGEPLEIDGDDLVPGDVVLLDAGRPVSADVRSLVAHTCVVDTSTLTGRERADRRRRRRRVLAGTFVTEGEGAARVVRHRRRDAAGRHRPARPRPALGRLSPLARELHRVVRTIAIVAVAVGVGVLRAWRCSSGTPAADGFLFAVGVTVALVPEGLLPTVTAVAGHRCPAHGRSGTRWCAGSKRWRRWGRPRSSAPTRPAR